MSEDEIRKLNETPMGSVYNPKRVLRRELLQTEINLRDKVLEECYMSAKIFLENITKKKIESDRVHLYNIEAKDLLNWMEDYAKWAIEEYKKDLYSKVESMIKEDLEKLEDSTVCKNAITGRLQRLNSIKDILNP